MKKNRLLLAAIPVLIVLTGLILYQYGYLTIKESLAQIIEEQAIKTKSLQKFLAAIAERGELEKKLGSLSEQRKNDKAKLMTGETVSLSAVALQEMVKGIIVSRGGVISSERIGKEEIPVSISGPPKEEAKTLKGEKGSKAKKEKSEEKKLFKIVNVSFDFVAPETGALRDILFYLETKVPYLVVKELDCRVRNFKEPRELMIKLDISALYGGK